MGLMMSPSLTDIGQSWPDANLLDCGNRVGHDLSMLVHGRLDRVMIGLARYGVLL